MNVSNGSGKTIRIRVKSFEEIPEREKCCEKIIDNIKKREGDIYLVALETKITSAVCPYCYFNYGRVKTFQSPFGPIPVDCVDIDESYVED